MSDYEMNKIYAAKVKKTFDSDTGEIRRGEYLGCMKKEDNRWYTSDDNFKYAWGWNDWMDTFDKPFSIFNFTGPLDALSEVIDEFLKPMCSTPAWYFRTDTPNWDLLCADLIQENIPLALISNNDRCYIMGIYNRVFEWDKIFDDYFIQWEEDIEKPYDVFEVFDKESCMALVKEFTERYRNWHKSTRKKAIKRSNKLKNKNTWGVYV